MNCVVIEAPPLAVERAAERELAPLGQRGAADVDLLLGHEVEADEAHQRDHDRGEDQRDRHERPAVGADPGDLARAQRPEPRARLRGGFGVPPRSSFGARLRSRVPQYGHSVMYGDTSEPQLLQTTNRSGPLAMDTRFYAHEEGPRTTASRTSGSYWRTTHTTSEENRSHGTRL